MPTSNYDSFERWIDSVLCGTNVTYNHQANTITVKKSISPFEIQSVLSNRKKNAFTVVWTDGTHTTVHCQSGDKWDDEKALAMCFTKKALGNKGNFNDKFNDALDNKMKIITAEPAIKMSDSSISFTRPITLNEEAVKKMVEAPEKACDCDGKRDHGIHSCTECKCKEEALHSPINGQIEEEETLTKTVEKLQSTCAKTEKAKNAFGINAQTASELSKATNKASNSLKEMIDALIGETEKVKQTTPIYKVYVKNCGVSQHDSDFTSLPALRARVKKLATGLFGRTPYYYRAWMSDGKMQIDFGSYTKFIEIEGITPDEYAKN